MNLAGKNVFLSGPMTGYDHNNIEAFARAHAIVHEAGAASVYNPAFAWISMRLEDASEKTHEDWMLKCVSELTRSKYCGECGPFYDLLVSLPFWEKSEGAVHERACAEQCGIRAVDLSEILLGQE